jgi:hypothetical protein
MSLREILWDDPVLDRGEAVWFLEGTGYNDDDELVEVVYRIPDEVRADIIGAGCADLDSIPVVWINVTQRDRAEGVRRKLHTHGIAPVQSPGR